MKMKPGRYVGVRFTADQATARAMYARAQEQETCIVEALRIMLDTCRTRADWHAWLDRRLEGIERLRAEANELFADVAESFTISTSA